MGTCAEALRAHRAAVVAWRAGFTPLSSSLPPQLWYFWRRRLFIWISFMDSYFEILLYVSPHSSFISGRGHQAGFRGEDPGPGSSKGLGPEHRPDSGVRLSSLGLTIHVLPFL